MRRTLIVTNDYPPRRGGIQSFVHELAVRQPAGSVVVYASDHKGSAEFDASLPFPVLRHPTGLLLPTPTAKSRIVDALHRYGCSAVWFGASAPLGLLAPAVRRAGAQRVVASTHGHEVAWAKLPVGRQALHRIGTYCDVVTYLGEYTRVRIQPALGSQPDVQQLTPGVDVETFRPNVDGSIVRVRHGLGERPVIVCVSRLVARKGQDSLIRALPAVRRAIPDAALLLVGSGPYHDELIEMTRRAGVSEHVVITGAVEDAELPAHYAAGDVFAMPCRTRRAGMDVEGLGIVYLEASAVGLPVVAGNSGGAPDAVREGETGYVVGGADQDALVARLVQLLANATLRAQMGAAGRSWVERDWRWEVLAERLTALLQA